MRAQRSTGQAAAAAYVHAARVARLADLGERRAALIALASRACPDDDAIAALVETQLIEERNADALLAHYRERFERTTTRAAYVARMHAAGVELVACNLQPGLGLRLLRMSLETAYAELLPEVTAHIATWELLWAHARAQRSTLDLVPLIVQAMAAPLAEDTALYLARLGLEIAWRDAADPIAAQPFAATVLDFVPDHPFASAFAREVALSAGSEATTPTPRAGCAPVGPSGPPPRTPATSQPTPTSRIPIPGTMNQANHRTNARIARLTEVGWGLAFVDASPELIAAIRASTA